MRSQQIAVRGAVAPAPLPCIEIEAYLFKRLSDIANKEHVPLKVLASELLRYMLLFEKSEVKKVIDQIKRNHRCPDR